MCVDALGIEGGFQLERVIREIQPLVFVLDAQGAATGIHRDQALGATVGQVQLQVGVELALPGEVFRQKRREAVEGELLEVVTQFGLRHQPLVFAAKAGRTGHPAMRSKGQLAIGQALDFRRGLQFPVLAAGLHITTGQAPAPVALVEVAVQGQGQFEQRAGQVQLDFLRVDIALGGGGERAQLGLAALNAAALEIDGRALGIIQGGAEAQALQAVVGKRQLLALEVEFAVGRLEAAGHIETTVDLPTQLRPQLGQTRGA